MQSKYKGDKASRISSAVTKASVKTYISKLEEDLNEEKQARILI